MLWCELGILYIKCRRLSTENAVFLHKFDKNRSKYVDKALRADYTVCIYDWQRCFDKRNCNRFCLQKRSAFGRKQR